MSVTNQDKVIFPEKKITYYSILSSIDGQYIKSNDRCQVAGLFEVGPRVLLLGSVTLVSDKQ